MVRQLPLLNEATINEGDVVFVRIDCNVPLDDKQITDTFRLEAVGPTLDFLKRKRARVIIAGAIGRPKGKRDDMLSTSVIADYFQGRIFETCLHSRECIDESVKRVIASMDNGSALVLENLRFWSEEESNDEEFARRLASLADIYVNDAFGQSHRKQASIVAITQYLPSYAGICLQKEVDALNKVLVEGKSPVVGIIGGAKVSDKLGVIEALLDRCDSIIVGGAMAYTFLKANGVSIGNSLCEEEFIQRASEWMKTGRIVIPVDSIVAPSIDSTDTAVATSIEDGFAGFDIGPKTCEKFSSVIASAQTILWNGPMGVFEKPQFANGTQAIGRAVADSTAFSVVGGGDSVAAIRMMKLEDRVNHVSTGGGATLEYLELGSLVGIDALTASKVS